MRGFQGLILSAILGITTTVLYSAPLPVPSDLMTMGTDPFGSLFSKHPLVVWAVPAVLVLSVDSVWSAEYERSYQPRFQSISRGAFPHRRDYAMTQSFQILLMAQTASANHTLRRLGYLSAISWIDATMFSIGVKFLTGRARPSVNTTPQDWFHYGHGDVLGNYTSFPSSHATIYFSVSTIWGKFLGNDLLGDGLGLANFLIMEGTHNHYISDMVAGYLLGKAIGQYVWDTHSKDDLREAWILYPIYANESSQFFGFGLLRQF